MPHTYSLQNVPSYVAAGEAHYPQLLAEAAEARRFVPEPTRHAAGAWTVGAALRRATGSVLIRLGAWLQEKSVPETTDTAPWPYQGSGDGSGFGECDSSWRPRASSRLDPT